MGFMKATRSKVGDVGAPPQAQGQGLTTDGGQESNRGQESQRSDGQTSSRLSALGGVKKSKDASYRMQTMDTLTEVVIASEEPPSAAPPEDGKNAKGAKKAPKAAKGAAATAATASPDDAALDEILANDPHYAAAYASINRTLAAAGPDAGGADALFATERLGPPADGAEPPPPPAESDLGVTLRKLAHLRNFAMAPNQPLLLLEDRAGRMKGWEGHTQFGHVPKGSADGRSVQLLLERKAVEEGEGGGDSPEGLKPQLSRKSSEKKKKASRSSRASRASALDEEPTDMPFTYDSISQFAIPWGPKELSQVAKTVKDVNLLHGLRGRLREWTKDSEKVLESLGGQQAIDEAQEVAASLALQIEKETRLKEKLEAQLGALPDTLRRMKERQAERGNEDGDGGGGGGDDGGGATGILGAMLKGDDGGGGKAGKSRLASGLRWERVGKTAPRGALGLTWQLLPGKPNNGKEIKAPKLREQLAKGCTKFESKEFDALAVGVGLKWREHKEKPAHVIQEGEHRREVHEPLKTIVSSALSSLIVSSGGEVAQSSFDLLNVPGLARDCVVETGDAKSGTQRWWTPVVDRDFNWDCYIDAGGSEGGEGYVERWYRPQPAAQELKPGKGVVGRVDDLQAALGNGTLEFDKEDWAELGITGLRIDHYVRATDGFYCVPDRAQPTPWARERSHVFKKVVFNAWRVDVILTAVTSKLKTDDQRQKAAEKQAVKLRVLAMTGDEQMPVLAEMQAIIADLDHVSTPLLQERMLHDLAEFDVPAGTKDHTALMGLLKPLKFVSKWGKTYAKWLDKNVDVYEEWCKANDEEAPPRDDAGTITARSSDEEEEDDDEEEDGDGADAKKRNKKNKKKKNDKDKVKRPTPKAIEKILDTLLEADVTISTIKKLGEQAIAPETLEDLATDALQMGGGAGLRRYRASQRVLVRKKNFFRRSYSWVEGEVTATGEPTGKHKLKIGGWGASVQLHPWNHAPLELPVALFEQKRKEYVSALADKHENFSDPLLGALEKLDVLATPEDAKEAALQKDEEKYEKLLKHAATLKIEVQLTEDEKVQKTKDDEQKKKEEDAKAEKEEKEKEKRERMEEADKRKKAKAKKKLGKAKQKEQEAKDEEKKMQRASKAASRKTIEEKKLKDREEKAKMRAERKWKPLADMLAVVDDDTLAQWLTSQHIERVNGKAVPKAYFTEEGTKTFRHEQKSKRKAVEASAYRIKTLGTLTAEPPNDDVAKQVERFVADYQAAHAAKDATMFLEMWALESGLRWHNPFGHPSIDGMDRIRATALKALPEVAKLEVEGILYAQDEKPAANEFSSCTHVALLCTVTLQDDKLNHRPGAVFKRLDLCAFTADGFHLKELTCFVQEPPETEPRFAEMKEQMKRFNEGYVAALKAADADGCAAWKDLWSTSTELMSVEKAGRKVLEQCSNIKWFAPYGAKPIKGINAVSEKADSEIRGFRDVSVEQVYYGAVPTHAVLHYGTRAAASAEGGGAIGPNAITLGGVGEEAGNERVAFLNIYTFEEPEPEVVEEKKTRGRKEEVVVKEAPKKLKGAEDPGYWGFSDTRVDIQSLKEKEKEAKDKKGQASEQGLKIQGRAGACCLVTGAPASGKTLFCSQLIMRTLDLVNAKGGPRSDLVPILLKGQILSRWLKDSKHTAKFQMAWNWVDAYLQIEYENKPEMYLMLRQALMARRGLVIIDGIDQGGGEFGEAIETHLLEVLAPQGHVLVATARPDARMEERFVGCHLLHLMPMSAEDQGRYVRQRIGDDDGGHRDNDKFELLRYLGSVVPMEPGTQDRITANPLLLSMLIALFQNPPDTQDEGGEDDNGKGVGAKPDAGGGDVGDEDEDDDGLFKGSGRLPATITEVYQAAMEMAIEGVDFRQLDASETSIELLPTDQKKELVELIKRLVLRTFFQAHSTETAVIDAEVFDKAAFELMKNELKVDAQVQDKYAAIVAEREDHKRQLKDDYNSQIELLKNQLQHELDITEVDREIAEAQQRMADGAEATETHVQKVMDAVEILSKAVLGERMPLLTIMSSDPEGVQFQASHMSFQEYYCAKAIRDGCRLPMPPWKWTKWWQKVLTFGGEMGTDFFEGLYLASRVSTVSEKEEVEEGVIQDKPVLRRDEQNEPVLNLNLTKDKIGGDRETSVAAVGQMLRVATTAYLVGNEITGEEVELLFPRDEKSFTCPKLKYLDLHRNSIGVPEPHSGLVLGMERLSEAIRAGRLSALAGLDLHGNGIDKEGTRLLSSALSKRKCPHLKVVVLDKFEIFDQEATSYDAYARGLNDDDLNIIGMLLENGAMPFCTDFNLLGNSFGKKEINEFVQILEKRETDKILEKRKAAKLREAAKLEEVGRLREADELREVAKLPQDDPDPARDVIFTLVGDKLRGSHASFTGFELKDEDVELIAQTLAHGGPFAHLKELDFSYNPVGDDALIWLMEKIGNGVILSREWTPDPSRPDEIVKHLPNLRGLNLSSTNIGHEGMDALFKAMERGCMRDLHLLSLMRNNITDDSLKGLTALAMESEDHSRPPLLRSLKTLYIGRNKVSSAPFVGLADALKVVVIDIKTGEHKWRYLPALKEIYFTDRDKEAAGGFSEELFVACKERNITYKHKSERR